MMEGQEPSEGDLNKVKQIYDKLMKEKGSYYNILNYSYNDINCLFIYKMI